MPQTLNRQWAGQILAQVQAVAQEPDRPYQRKYGSMSHTLPVLIRTAGLAQALAFVAARGKEPQQRLLKDLAITIGYNDQAALLADSQAAELDRYMYLTGRVLTALLWYKRFAQSVLKVESGADDDAGEEEE